MNLRRYDIHIVEEFNDCTFLEEEDCADGAHVSAFEALDIITVQKERIEKMEKALREIREHKCGNCGAQNMADDALGGK
jgi:hypothetical protein